MSMAPEPVSTSRPRRQEGALVALYCLLPILAGGGGLGLAPLLAICGLAAAPVRRPHGDLALAFVMLLTIVWAGISVCWSPAPRPEQALKILGVVITGLLLTLAAANLPASSRRIVRYSVLGGVLALAFFLSIEGVFDMPLNRIFQPDATTELLQRNPGRGVVVLEALGFAALGAMADFGKVSRIALSALLVVAMGALSLQFDMEANGLAFAFGVGGYALGFAAPRLGPSLTGLALAIWMIAAPWVMLAQSRTIDALATQLPPSWGMRLQIWSYASEKIAQKPLFGWGLDSSRVFDDPAVLGDLSYKAIPLHPHSVSLQVWLETGGVGALLVASVLVLAGFSASRAFSQHPAAAAVVCAGMAALGVTWNLSYGAWQEWFMALPFILAAAAFALRRDGSAGS